MKNVNVSAAVIREGGRIFATERGYGEYKDFWEFPGGKIEEGESAEEALIREIREELEMEIRTEKKLGVVDTDYETFHLTMHVFLCSIVSGKPELLEHEDARWLTAEELDSVNWLPADREILPEVRKEMEE